MPAGPPPDPVPELVVLTRAGVKLRVPAQPGASAMAAIHAAGITELLAFCGGWCACATCHVYIDPTFAPHLAPISDLEEDLLATSAHRTAQSRLACQIMLSPTLNGLALTIAPED